VAEVAHRCHHALASGGAHLARCVQDVGNGAGCHAGGARHIGDGGTPAARPACCGWLAPGVRGGVRNHGTFLTDLAEASQSRADAVANQCERKRRMPEMTITPIGDVTAIVGEAPLWSAAEQALFWIDGQQRRLMRWRDGATQVLDLPYRPSCLVPLADGR